MGHSQNDANGPVTPHAALQPAAGAGSGQDFDASLQPIQEKRGRIARLLKSHPIGFWFFFWGEFAERASFYGMKAILTLYMINELKLNEANAGTTMSVFIAGCYFLPLIGGWIADRYLGKYWTIVGFSLPYVVGQLMIGISHGPFPYIAMALLAMGSGVIKPNISTLMGLTYDQQRPGQDQLRSDAFSMFYGAINIGSAMSTLVMPELRTRYGYFAAFMFPAVLMTLALTLFALGKRFYAVEVIQRTEKTPEERAQQWALLGRLFGLFLLVTFFWAIFDQHATTWIFFAKKYLDLNLFGYEVQPDQVQALNPIFIVAFLPVASVLWRLLARWGLKVRPTDKMVVGFLLTAGAMAVHAVAGYLAVQSGAKVSLAWQVGAFLVITFAEILISVTGLELAFTAAPKAMKGFVTGCWLVTVAAANLFINAYVTRLYPSDSPGWHFPTPAGYFTALTLMMLVVTVAFVFVARQFNRAMAAPAADAGPAQAPAEVPEDVEDVTATRPDSVTGQKPV
ncbi:MAG TPA: MFS transporter [Gemmataceae bacterium]|nr:MFS transporter [Gemmataceae bacterium]